jgi:signal transduction histidine kinase
MFFFAHCFCAAALCGDPSIVYRARVGDSPAWALPEYNDNAWPSSAAPEPLALNHAPHIGWYRMAFELPEDAPPGGWGVALGHIRTADEAYLNGTRIGGEGRIGPHFVDAFFKERVYPLPQELLHPGTNLLALRVQSSSTQGGLQNEGAVFGDYQTLLRDRDLRATRRKLMETFLLGMLAVVILFWILLLARRIHSPEYIHFGILITLFSLIVMLESLFWYDHGLATPFSQRLTISLFLLLPAPLVFFGRSLMQQRHSSRLALTIVGISIMMAAYFLFAGTLQTCYWFEGLWMVLLFISGMLLLRQAYVLRIWRQSAAPVTVFIGLALFGICALLEYVFSKRMPALVPFSSVLYIGFILLVASMATALAIRFREMNDRLRALSRQLLTAQENERRQLAGELHNGLAPTLAGIKLEGQLMLRKHNLTEAGSGLISQLSNAIEDIRTLSHALHPAAVEQLGFTTALSAHARRIADANEWSLALDLPPTLDQAIPAEIAVSLYRIVQELLANIEKHAVAQKVTLAIQLRANQIHLRLCDDGCGCDTSTEHPRAGIGWTTLRERIDALDGHVYMRSQQGKGLEVNLWLPLP